AVVRRTEPAPLPRDGRRCRAEWRRAAPAGAMGMPPGLRFSRFRGHDLRGPGQAGRCSDRVAVGPPLEGPARRRRRWRPRRGGCRPGDYRDPCRRTRREPRRRHRGRGAIARGFGPVRRARAVDERCRDAAGPAVLAQDRHAHGQRDDHRDQAQGRRRYPGGTRGQAPRTQRDRRVQPQSRPGHSVRAVRGRSHARRLHPHRSADQRDVHQDARAAIKGQTPRCLWFTGLSGSGKSTIANVVERRLLASGHHTYLLDGDNVRHGLNKDLGFTDEDRVENIRRVAEVARLMVDAGLIVLVSFISPFRSERQLARDLFARGEFAEVFVDTPLEVAEARDVKGLYAKARAGDLKNFTGIDSPYEQPEAAEIVLDTTRYDVETLAGMVIDWTLRDV